MFGLFKKVKTKEQAGDEQKRVDQRARKIAMRILACQGRLADDLNKRFGRYSTGKQKLILLLAGILLGGICLYRMITGLSR